MVVVALITVVLSCPKTEAARVTASVMKVAKKRILIKDRMNKKIQRRTSCMAMRLRQCAEQSGVMIYALDVVEDWCEGLCDKSFGIRACPRRRQGSKLKFDRMRVVATRA
jgi:hypothetical protein